MLDKIKEKLIEQLKTASKDGIKTGNIEYISKLAETYKNLNKAEKEELETMMYDERMDGERGHFGRGYRDEDRYGDEYAEEHDERYGRRHRRRYGERDSRGRYADAMIPLEDRYSDYMDIKRRYRAHGAPKEDMHKGLEMMMKYMVKLVEDIYHECDSEEERRVMDKYLRKLSEIQ